MSRHTPTPWEVDAKPVAVGIVNAFGWIVAECGEFSTGLARQRAEANAAHIVHCVNSHAALVEALQECERFFGDDSNHWEWGGGEPLNRAKFRAALAKATGGQ